MPLTMTTGTLLEGVKLARIILTDTLPKGTITAGSATGTMGNSTVAVASATPVTGTLLVGDKFTIAGDTCMYTVTANATAATGAIASLSIEPPLQKNCTSAVMTITSGNLTYNFDTAEDVDLKPKVEKGIDKVKRNKNTVIGRVRTDDLVSGFEIALKQSTMIPQVLQIIDGGTLTGTGMTTQYTAPAVGVATVKKQFTLELYTASLDTSGNVLHYVKFAFPNCTGNPVDYAFKDGEFFVPELNIDSNPASGASPYTWNYIAALPTS